MDKYMEQAIANYSAERNVPVEFIKKTMEDFPDALASENMILRASELRLLDTLRRFTSIIREVTPTIDSMCILAAVHGKTYSGPQYGPTLEEAEALLAEYKDVKTD